MCRLCQRSRHARPHRRCVAALVSCLQSLSLCGVLAVCLMCPTTISCAPDGRRDVVSWRGPAPSTQLGVCLTYLCLSWCDGFGGVFL